MTCNLHWLIYTLGQLRSVFSSDCGTVLQIPSFEKWVLLKGSFVLYCFKNIHVLLKCCNKPVLQGYSCSLSTYFKEMWIPLPIQTSCHRISMYSILWSVLYLLSGKGGFSPHFASEGQRKRQLIFSEPDCGRVINQVEVPCIHSLLIKYQGEFCLLNVLWYPLFGTSHPPACIGGT